MTPAVGDGAGMPRVVTVTGPESTGKTTLAAALAARYDTAWSAEYARVYVERRAADGHPAPAALEPADVAPIARGQMAAEDAAFARAMARPLVVRDTDLVSTVVYARHYYGACPLWIEEAARDRRAALYLLCAPDTVMRPDGVRDPHVDRAALHAAFAATLAEFRCTVTRLAGAWAAREAAACAAIDRLLGGPRGPTG